jgi:predicted PurR-regulated permease PerM
MQKPLPPPWDRFVPFLKRCFVWALFFGVLWFLRPFFFLVFLTFVFGYIQAHGVDALEGRIGSRKLTCVLVFLALLGILLGLGFTIGPSLASQAAAFPRELGGYLDEADAALAKLRDQYPFLQASIRDVRAREIVNEFLGFHAQTAPAPGGEDERWRELLPLVVSLVGKTLAVGTSFILALLFSFLVVLDLPRLTAGVRTLRDTKLRFIYEEVSETVFHFGKILGRALEAQLIIALCNTALTAIGLAIMGLPSLVFLSAVVFVCSFIPVVGVFISSVPICLVALKMQGFGLVLVAIAFITLIHMIEAYILNPKIMGAHLHINPVLVLAILVISHHVFGVWGLILGVPIVTYFFAHAIRRGSEPPKLEEQAA